MICPHPANIPVVYQQLHLIRHQAERGQKTNPEALAQAYTQRGISLVPWASPGFTGTARADYLRCYGSEKLLFFTLGDGPNPA